MLWVRIGVYHTQFSVAYFLVSTLLSKIFDVGDRDLPVLTSGNWVIKGWVIKWPVKLRTFFTFLRFFKIQKTWLLTFFWVAGHVFSNTGTTYGIAVDCRIQPPTWRCGCNCDWGDANFVYIASAGGVHLANCRQFFSVCCVAKLYIIKQTCLKKLIGSCLLGMRRYNF